MMELKPHPVCMKENGVIWFNKQAQRTYHLCTVIQGTPPCPISYLLENASIFFLPHHLSSLSPLITPGSESRVLFPILVTLLAEGMLGFPSFFCDLQKCSVWRASVFYVLLEGAHRRPWRQLTTAMDNSSPGNELLQLRTMRLQLCVVPYL